MQSVNETIASLGRHLRLTYAQWTLVFSGLHAAQAHDWAVAISSWVIAALAFADPAGKPVGPANGGSKS